MSEAPASDGEGCLVEWDRLVKEQCRVVFFVGRTKRRFEIDIDIAIRYYTSEMVEWGVDGLSGSSFATITEKPKETMREIQEMVRRWYTTQCRNKGMPTIEGVDKFLDRVSDYYLDVEYGGARICPVCGLAKKCPTCDCSEGTDVPDS